VRLSFLMLVAVVLVGSIEARGAGFYFGDNGAKAMVQGGAFTAQADDLTAMQHNPAGLTQLKGLSFLVDGNLMQNDVTFWRQDPGWNPDAPSNLMEKVSRSGGLFISPFVGASYGLELFGKPFTVALGFFAPPAIGRNEYPAPDYTKDAMTGRYVTNPRRFAPNRYMQVKQDIIIVYPTLSLAFSPHRMVQVGVSAQLVVSTFDFNQAVYSGLSDPTKSTEEDPIFDSLVTAKLNGTVGVTGIAGVMVRPTDSLSFGASVRPPVPIRARGKLSFELGEAATSLNTQVTGDQAELAFDLPLEVRVGARYSPSKTWGVNADFVYQGWNSLTALTLTPLDVTLKIGAGVATKVEPFRIPKNWVGTFSARVGGSYRPIEWLSVSAGVWYETSAQPSEFFALDFPHPNRVFITGGLTGHLGSFGATGFLGNADVIAGFVYTPVSTLNITDSKQRQGQTTAGLEGGLVGMGQYTVGGWVVTLGVRGNFQFK
jgi:long-chain fatty acid transport protein